MALQLAYAQQEKESTIGGTKPTKNLKKFQTGKGTIEEEITMVYCTKCGTKNEDDALVCVKCGASLETGKYPARRYKRKEWEEECFGIPYGGTVVGLVIGIIIVLAGSIWLLQQANLIPATVEIWPFVVIIFGILIVVGALYKYGRRY